MTLGKIFKMRKKKKNDIQIKTTQFAFNENIFLIYSCAKIGANFVVSNITGVSKTI